MCVIGLKRVVQLTARVIFVCFLILQYETAAVRLHSSSLFGFVGHSLRLNSYQARKPCHEIAPLPRIELRKLHAFNPVKSFFNALVKVPSLIFRQKEQTGKDSTLEDTSGYEIDQEKQWRREELDELEHWHYWTSEQKRLREEKEANQKLQWPEVVARCVTEPLRKERQQQQASQPSEQPTAAPSLSSDTIDGQQSYSNRPQLNYSNRHDTKTRPKPSRTLSPQPWSTDEETLLAELVPQHTITPQLGMTRKHVHRTQPYVDWVFISHVLHRTVLQCKTKWRVLCDRHAKKGRFTAQEDALIEQRVAEWFRDLENETSPISLSDPNTSGEVKFSTMSKKGLWVALDRELHRKTGSVLKHWRMQRKVKK